MPMGRNRDLTDDLRAFYQDARDVFAAWRKLSPPVRFSASGYIMPGKGMATIKISDRNELLINGKSKEWGAVR